jgi:hypothetical protein
MEKWRDWFQIAFLAVSTFMMGFGGLIQDSNLGTDIAVVIGVTGIFLNFLYVSACIKTNPYGKAIYVFLSGFLLLLILYNGFLSFHALSVWNSLQDCSLSELPEELSKFKCDCICRRPLNSQSCDTPFCSKPLMMINALRTGMYLILLGDCLIIGLDLVLFRIWFKEIRFLSDDKAVL